jgi:hypothetical protein
MVKDVTVAAADACHGRGTVKDAVSLTVWHGKGAQVVVVEMVPGHKRE